MRPAAVMTGNPIQSCLCPEARGPALIMCRRWLQGAACHLLEQYEEGEAAYLTGLGLDPASLDLQEALTALREAAAGDAEAVVDPSGTAKG